MQHIAKIFVSSTSKDLRSYRQIVAQWVRDRGMEAIVQEDFEILPDFITIAALLRNKIAPCDAVICLVGEFYGFEPSNFPPGEARRSYTQLEYELAQAFLRPTHLFLTTPECVLDSVPDQSKEHRELQQAYRERLTKRSNIRYSFSNATELLSQLEKLSFLKSDRPTYHKPQNLPFGSIGTLFKGRDEFLQQLRLSLTERPTHIAAVVSKQAIHGLGGVGKTRAAVEYAWKYAPEYTALLFVSADSPTNLQRNMADLCGAMVLNLPEQAEKEDEIKAAAAIRWLQQHPGWFLILDNVDTPEAATRVEQLLTGLSTGHVVITSRLAEWGQGVEPLELDVLSESAAVDFLLDRTEKSRRTSTTDQTDAVALAKELGGLALALEQAGAYIAKLHIGFDDYSQKWKEGSERVQEWFDERIMKYPRSIAVTWDTTVNQLDPAARTLLRLLCWLAPEPIPRALLETETARKILVERTRNPAGSSRLRRWFRAITRLAFPGRSNAIHVEESLASLAAYSLAKFDESRAFFRIHRLVEEVTRLRIPESHQRTWIDSVLDMVDQYAGGDSNEIRNWPIWTPLAPHVMAIVDHAEKRGIDYPTSSLMARLGAHYQAKALYSEAESLFRRALSLDEQALGDDHLDVGEHLCSLGLLLKTTHRLQEAEPLLERALKIHERHKSSAPDRIANSLSTLGLIYANSNRWSEAEPLLRRALEIAEQTLGKEHPNVAIHLNNLATLLVQTNRLREAEPLLQRAVAVLEAALGADHPTVAEAIHNYAFFLDSTNRTSEAEPLLRRTLDISLRAFGDDHPHIASELGTLGSLLLSTNRMTEAEPMLRRALEIDEHFFGKDHPKVAMRLNNLGTLLFQTNRIQEAEPLMRRALEIDRRASGDDHPHVASDMISLSYLLQSTNRHREAEPMILRAIAIFEQSLGLHHPKVSVALNHLANLFLATNRLQEAEPLQRRALEIDEQSFGPDHPEVANRLAGLAYLLQSTNRVHEAEPLLLRALAIEERSLGKDHPTVANHLLVLATVLQGTNRLPEAELLQRRALAILETSYGNEHTQVATALQSLAFLLMDTNRYAEAEQLLQRALAIFRASLGDHHPNVASALNAIAMLFKATKRLQEAEPLLQQSLAIFRQSYGDNHPHVASALNTLGLLYHLANRFDLAEKCLRKVVEIYRKSYGDEHPKVATVLNNLAQVFQATNRLNEAAQLYVRAIQIAEKALGKSHPTVGATLTNLGSLLKSANRLKEAEAILRRAVGIFRDFARQTGHQHADGKTVLSHYSDLLRAAGLTDEQIQNHINQLLAADTAI